MRHLKSVLALAAMAGAALVVPANAAGPTSTTVLRLDGPYEVEAQIRARLRAPAAAPA